MTVVMGAASRSSERLRAWDRPPNGPARQSSGAARALPRHARTAVGPVGSPYMHRSPYFWTQVLESYWFILGTPGYMGQASKRVQQRSGVTSSVAWDALRLRAASGKP